MADQRGRWSSDDPTPKSRWTRLYVRDLGKDPKYYRPCEMGCATSIRFVHLMERDGVVIEAGCVCSANMSLGKPHSQVPRSDIENAIGQAELSESGVRAASEHVEGYRRALEGDRKRLLELKSNLDVQEARQKLSDMTDRALKRVSYLEEADEQFRSFFDELMDQETFLHELEDAFDQAKSSCNDESKHSSG